MNNPSVKKAVRGAAAILVILSALVASAGPARRASGPPETAAQAPKTLPAPDRGFISSALGENWEQGLLSGNGTIGASVLGRPLDEVVVFSHKHMFVPERAPLLPPAPTPAASPGGSRARAPASTPKAI